MKDRLFVGFGNIQHTAAPNQFPHRRVGGLAAPLLLALLASGCGGAPETGEERAATNGDESVGSTSQALSDAKICSTINKIASLAIDATNVPVKASVRCGTDSTANTYFLGSAAPADFMTSSSKREGEAIYCAVAAADGHHANALFDAPVGKFGVQGRVAVLDTDPTTLRVSAQKIGRLYAYGVALDVESQKFTFQGASEYQFDQVVLAVDPAAGFYTQEIPEQVGAYTVLTQSGHYFAFSGSANIDTPVPGLSIHEGVSWVSGAPFDSSNNYWFGPANPTNSNLPLEVASEAARVKTWATYAAQQAARCPGIGCDSRYPEMIEQHNRISPPLENLNDYLLPYEGTAGATTNTYDNGSPLNWWHFGTPSGGNVVLPVSGEPVFPLNDDTYTAGVGVDVGLTFGYKIFHADLQIANKFQYKSGFAVREKPLDPENHDLPRAAQIGTWMDSEASANIAAQFRVAIDIPFVGNKTILSASYNLYTNQARSNANNINASSSVSWTTTEPSDFLTVQSGGVDVACPPAMSQPEVPVVSPGDFASAVGEASSKAYWPCDISYCDPTSKKLQRCDFNADRTVFTCQATTTACVCGDASASICDAKGEHQPVAVTHPYCDIPTCSDSNVCSTGAQCGGGICDKGCCVTVK